MIKTKAVFLDLQGTLGGEAEGDVLDFYFYPFAIEAIKLLNSHGILAIVVTNQSRIAKGYLTLADYEKKIEEIKAELRENGAYLDAIYCCPHSKEDKCGCKKPLPGLIRQAEKDFHIAIEESFIIGDMGNSDMLLANNVGAKGILVKTGNGVGSLTKYLFTWEAAEPYLVCEDVLEAIKHIIKVSVNI